MVSRRDGEFPVDQPCRLDSNDGLEIRLPTTPRAVGAQVEAVVVVVVVVVVEAVVVAVVVVVVVADVVVASSLVVVVAAAAVVVVVVVVELLIVELPWYLYRFIASAPPHCSVELPLQGMLQRASGIC